LRKASHKGGAILTDNKNKAMKWAFFAPTISKKIKQHTDLTYNFMNI